MKSEAQVAVCRAGRRPRAPIAEKGHASLLIPYDDGRKIIYERRLGSLVLSGVGLLSIDSSTNNIKGVLH